MTTLTKQKAPPAALAAPGLTGAASEALALWRDEPQWVRNLRARGWEAWLDIPLPTPTTEGWRHTKLDFLALGQLRAVAPAQPRVERIDQLPPAIRKDLESDFEVGALLVQQNGATTFGEIRDDLREQGVILTDLGTALREHRDLLGQHFMQLVPPRWQPGMPSNAGKFEALNAAFFDGGVFIYVPPDTKVTLPVRTLMWASDPGVAFFPRTVIVVDRNSSLVYLDEYRSAEAAVGGPTVFGSGVVEVYVKDGAHLDYVTIQEWSLSTTGFLTQRASLGNNAYINWVQVQLGGQYSRSTAELLLQGKGTKADLLGLAFGEGTQEFDIHTYQDHLSPFTDSDQIYKTALRDRGHVTYEGMINIRRGSYGSNGYQANKNLLLDDTAMAQSLPMLEISDNDVRCTHSSSVGPIEQQHVYYMMSRGISRPAAERMIVQGYFEPVIARIAVEKLKDRIRAAVDRKIGERRETVDDGGR